MTRGSLSFPLVLTQLRLATAGTSAWRASFEAVSFTVLTLMLGLTIGRARYEAVTTLAVAGNAGDQTAPAASAPRPDFAAKVLLARAAAFANDPPLADPSAPRTFRVDVLRDQRLTLVCQAENSALAQELCNGTVSRARQTLPGLRVVERARTSTYAWASVLEALWPALLVGFGWFLVRV